MTLASSRFLWLLKTSALILGLGIVLSVFRNVSLRVLYSSLRPEPARPTLAVQMPKLLPEEHLRNLFTYDGIWLFPKNQCKCDTLKWKESYNFQNAYSQTELPAVKARRQAEFEHFQRRLEIHLSQLGNYRLDMDQWFPKAFLSWHTWENGALYSFSVPASSCSSLEESYPSLANQSSSGAIQGDVKLRRAALPTTLAGSAQPSFGYPVYGVEVMPLHTVPIPGLRYEGPDVPIYEVTLTASLGTLNTLADIPDRVVQGRGQKQLTISTSSRKLLNFVLQHMTYTSTVYQLRRVDVVSLESKFSVAKFPVTIYHPVIPKLYDPGPERKLRDLVTVATKTFLRPHKLMIMLRSLRVYYPDLTVIVADDSKEPMKINDSHVEYYTMPFGKGWFAGRNLAVSQVTTKYVLWVDDDFLFNEKTKIEVLVDVLENSELDVVGGSVLGNVFQFKLLLEQSESGDCLHRRPGSFRPLDGFPSCVVTSGVVNFFLAHTEQLQRVGFDPRLQRVAHSEFFIDGLGSLLVGSCPEVIIGHQPRSSVVDPDLAALEKSYSAYRANTNAQIQFKLALHYFKNHLQCST